MADFASSGITDLNLNVLDAIFSHLPSLENKINVGMAHPYLGKAFAFHCRNQFREFSFWEWSTEQSDFILSVCGDTVKVAILIIHMQTIAMLRLCVKYCDQIENLKIALPEEAEYHVLVDLLKEMASKPKLKEIYLRKFFMGVNRDSAGPVIRALRHLPQLRNLKLDHFIPKEICWVNDLTDLEALQLKILVPTQRIDVFRMFANLNKLRSFEIFRGILDRTNGTGPLWPRLQHLRIIDAQVRFQFPYFPELKSLTIDCNDSRAIVFQSEYGNHLEKLEILRTRMGSSSLKEARVIGTLRSLKELNWQPRDNRGLEYLTHLNRLEKLTLVHSNQITIEGLLQVLRACKRLRQLKIERCGQIQPSFVLSVLQILRENDVQPDDPLTLIMDIDIIRKMEKLISVPDTELLILQIPPFYLQV